MKTLSTILIVMAFALLAWAIQERISPVMVVKRWCGRVVCSKPFIDVMVILMVVVPAFGFLSACWTGDWRWLLLLFFLCPLFA